MRIDSTPPAHAHGRHASSVDASQRSTSTAVETPKAGATVNAPETENPAAAAKAAGKPERPESGGKLTPAGLLAAQLRFQSMDSEDMNKGQARAFEVINRNIERYRANHGITTPPLATDTTPGTGATAETAPATGAEQPAATGTISPPLPTAGSEPTTVSADSTPATTLTTAA